LFFSPEEDLNCLELEEGVPNIYEDDEARIFHETELPFLFG